MSCGDYFEGKRLFPINLGALALHECIMCGFAAFYDMHKWSKERLKALVYNEQYRLADKPFKVERPTKTAMWIKDVLPPTSLLDYGGGEGLMAKILCENGFDAVCFDPYNKPETVFDELPKSNIVTCFEVVEHVANQAVLFATLKSFVKPGGTILFSTLLKPLRLNEDWYYASPRNGHMSFHTAQSLKMICASVGLNVVSLNQNIHVCGTNDLAIDTIEIIDTPAFKYSACREVFIKL